MKTLTTLPSFAMAIALFALPMAFAADSLTTPPRTTVPTATDSAVLTPNPDPVVASNTMPYTASRADRTASIIGWIIGLAILAMIVIWAIRSSRRRHGDHVVRHGDRVNTMNTDPTLPTNPANPNRSVPPPVNAP